MEHLLLKAAVSTATDKGVFDAVISTATIDREKDIVDPNGFARALQKWVPTGKKIPLAWNHSTAAEDQIGYIDPATVKAVGSEVHASGWIDQDTPNGAHAWRLVKAGTLGFSFGYLTLDSSPRKGGGRMLKEVDVYEVTATPTPMNNDTRVLGYKAARAVEIPDDAEVAVFVDRDRRPLMTVDEAAEKMNLDPKAMMEGAGHDRLLNSMLGQAREFVDGEPDAPDRAAMEQIIRELRALANREAAEPDEQQPKAVAPQPTNEPDPDMAQMLYAAAAGGYDSFVAALGACMGQDDTPAMTMPKAVTPISQTSAGSKAQDESHAVDPLEAKARDLVMEVRTGGLSRTATPKVEEQPTATPDRTPEQLREYSHQLIREVLLGVRSPSK